MQRLWDLVFLRFGGNILLFREGTIIKRKNIWRRGENDINVKHKQKKPPEK